MRSRRRIIGISAIPRCNVTDSMRLVRDTATLTLSCGGCRRLISLAIDDAMCSQVPWEVVCGCEKAINVIGKERAIGLAYAVCVSRVAAKRLHALSTAGLDLAYSRTPEGESGALDRIGGFNNQISTLTFKKQALIGFFEREMDVKPFVKKLELLCGWTKTPPDRLTADTPLRVQAKLVRDFSPRGSVYDDSVGVSLPKEDIDF